MAFAPNTLVFRLGRVVSALAAGTIAFGVLTAPASAQAIDPVAEILAQQNQWRPGFDAQLDESDVRTNNPILSPQIAAAMDIAIIRYQQIVSAGGWPIVPASETLRVGVQSPAVPVLRQRLIISGDLPSTAPITDVFDSLVEQGVRHFQARHGIPADGIAGPTTFAAMNISATQRLSQLVTNRQRAGELAATTEARYVLVNIPAAAIETVENGVVHSRHTAVVGKVDRPSPLLNSEIYEVNFNPFWTVPASIIERDLIPLMQTNPNYLTDSHIRIYNGQGVEIPPQQVNWYSNEATRYTFRQDPGGDFNALGSVRINFHNPYSVYLHDTPNKALFNGEYRFDSSGCVRVENVRELIYWLLRDNADWSRQAIDGAFVSGERVDARLAAPVQVFFAYISAWAMENGTVHFRDDIYALDGVGVASL